MLTIYGVAPSIHTRKIIVAALEKGLEYRLEPVFPFDPPAGWNKLSPTGKIPVLVDQGFQLADSSVILAYLEKQYPQHSLLPTAPRDYASALWIEEYCDGNIAPLVIALFQQKILGPKIRRTVTDETLVADIVNVQLPPKWDYIEGLLQGDFAVGKILTIADITIASQLLVYHYVGYEIDRERFPKLAAHFARMLSRPSFQTALRGEEPGMKSFDFATGFLHGVYQRVEFRDTVTAA